MVSAGLLLLISNLRAAACFAPLQSMTFPFRADIWAVQFVEVLPKDNLPLHVVFFSVCNQCVSATFLFRCYFFSLSVILSCSVSAPFYILLFSSLFFFPFYWRIFSICLGRLAPAFLCSVRHWQELSWLIWQTVFIHPLHMEFPWTPTALACKLHEQGRTTWGCLGTPWATSPTLGA